MDDSKLIERYRIICDEISDKYNYDSNIRHLLYVIVPAFVKKYGLNRETLISNTFLNVRVYISHAKNDNVNAYYTAIPRYINDKVVTDRMIVINNYDNISLVSLLDNLVHEFNHAINSYNNPVRWDDKFVYLRTGLTWGVYDKVSLIPIDKDSSYVLEEIINTKQTEDIINIIKNFNDKRDDIYNIIYSVNNETSSNYSSKAYYLESYICKRILGNKTFISTMEVLRISGDVNDIDGWFDNIVGEDGGYKKFIFYLNKILSLEMELSKTKYFRKFKINKIRDLSRELMIIIDEFDSNCHYS